MPFAAVKLIAICVALLMAIIVLWADVSLLGRGKGVLHAAAASAVSGAACLLFLFRGTGLRDILQTLLHLKFSYPLILKGSLGFLGIYLVNIILAYGIRRFSGNTREKFPGTALYITSALSLLMILAAFMLYRNAFRLLSIETADPASDQLLLYFDGNFTLPLKDVYLTDDPDDAEKFRLSDYTALPKVSITVDIAASPELAISEGEMLLLSTESGIVDRYLIQDPEALKPAMPVFSAEGGFYDSEFELTLTAEDGAQIYYTLDGSRPGENSDSYTGPIRVYDRSPEANRFKDIPNFTRSYNPDRKPTDPVPKAFIIRAVAVDGEGRISDIATKTYFVGQQELTDKQVISLVSDPDDLFGAEKGIYVTGAEYDAWYLGGQVGEEPPVNYETKWMESERETNVSLFRDGQEVMNQDGGIRIQGASTRYSREKRFSLYARDRYSGSDFFDYEIFPDTLTHSFGLRDGLNNAFLQDLVMDRAFAAQRSMPVTVYLNGEYWYDTFLQERYSEDYLEQKYDVDGSRLLIIKDNDYFDEDYALYTDLMDYCTTYYLGFDEYYEEFSRRFDIQSYIDYTVANVYINNEDYGLKKNWKIWCTKYKNDSPYADGRIRFLMYDVDGVNFTSPEYLHVPEWAAINTFTTEFSTGAVHKQIFFVALRQHPRFVKDFVNTFMDMTNYNFAIPRVQAIMEKWGVDINTWLDGFFLHRKDYIVPMVYEEMELTGTLETVTVSVNDPAMGKVKVNTITPEYTEGVWSGEYFTDFPVTLTAIPERGFRFVRWEGDLEDADPASEEIEVPVKEGGIGLYAVFEKE